MNDAIMNANWLEEYLEQEIEIPQAGVDSSFKVFLPIGNSNTILCQVCQPIREIILHRNNQDNWINHINSKLHLNQLKIVAKWTQYELEEFKLLMNDGPLNGKFSKEKAEEREKMLQRRQKQIDKGKNKLFYRHYIAEVPKLERGRYSPSTPDKCNTRISRRQFDKCIQAWEHQLNQWYQREINFNKENSRKAPSKLG